MIFGAILMVTALITGAITIFTERVSPGNGSFQGTRSTYQPHAYGYRSKAHDWRS